RSPGTATARLRSWGIAPSWSGWTTTARAPRCSSPRAGAPTGCSGPWWRATLASPDSRWSRRRSSPSSSPRWGPKRPWRRGRTGLSRKRAVADGLDGVLVLTEETLRSGKIQYYGTNVGSIAEMRRLEGILQPVVQRERLERLGVDPGVVLKAVGNVDLVTQKVAEGKLTGQSGEATFGLAYGMVFILYLTLMIYGSQVMTSVVEEKTSRIIEVLASSLRPFELMLGKVIGVGLVGLFQLSIWAGTALYLGSF